MSVVTGDSESERSCETTLIDDREEFMSAVALGAILATAVAVVDVTVLVVIGGFVPFFGIVICNSL